MNFAISQKKPVAFFITNTKYVDKYTKMAELWQCVSLLGWFFVFHYFVLWLIYERISQNEQDQN